MRVSDVALAGLASPYRDRMTLDDARYLSPEQAIGEPAGAKSDVYALALILFEAVTGSRRLRGHRRPKRSFARDSTRRCRCASSSARSTWCSLRRRCPIRDCVSTPSSSRQRLGAVVSDSAPLTVRPGSAELPLLAQFAPLEPRSSIGFRAPSADQIVSTSTPGFAHSPRGRVPEGAHASGPPRGPAGRAPRFDASAYDLPRNPGRRQGFLVAAVILVVVVIAAGVMWKEGVFGKSHIVPDLKGLTQQQASAKLTGDGYTLSVTSRVFSATVPVNDVVAQTPVAGTKEKSGQTIDVSVSKGPVLVTMPTNLVGETCAAATAALAKLHVVANCPIAYAIFSTTVSSGDVARVLYHKGVNPLAVPLRAKVILSLSKGTGTGTTTTTTTTTLAGEGARAVPNVIGDNPAEVNAAMKKAVLYYTTTGTNAGTNKWTTVIAENPKAGTMVAWKSTVTLTVK